MAALQSGAFHMDTRFHGACTHFVNVCISCHSAGQESKEREFPDVKISSLRCIYTALYGNVFT